MVRRATPSLRLAGLLAMIAWALAAPVAAADGCPSVDDGYTGTCGPKFEVPSWTDAGGWSDPSQYSTIHLADVNGDGTDELIGRSDAGIEIYEFDTTVGQWRPQVDASGVPQLLNDFASFLPADDWDPRDPNQPQSYSTIQAANIDGQPGAEILGRFSDGMRVFKYTPPAGTTSIDGGTWTRIGTGGPFSDADGYDEPSLYSTIHVGQFTRGGPALLFARKPGRSVIDTIAFYQWGSGGWSAASGGGSVGLFDDQDCGNYPSCYLTLQPSDLGPGGRDAPADTAELTGRLTFGAALWDVNAFGGWNWLNEDFDLLPAGFPPFGDGASPGPDFPYPDCPFSAGGATGPGSSDCVGSSPSYYETFQAADIDGVAGDELLARASDGLRVRKWVPGHSGGSWDVLATLTAAAGAASSVPDGLWGSIRMADINGDGEKEVLFLDGDGVQAWSYDRTADAWSQMPASPPLALAGDPWSSHPEYFSTIQTGDVDGDGHDDVIARGPYGIRTWFYNRRGTGGWERYLADGYPAFPGAATPPAQDSGQAAAYDALNVAYRAALNRTGTIRDVWTLENAPSSGFSDTLLPNLAGPTIGNCSSANGNQTSLAPPRYRSCTPPQGSTGFSQGDWTTVVNEILAEAFAADQVVGFFGDLKTMRDDLFLQESAELPAIGSDLGLQAAAGTSAPFNALGFASGVLGIAASVAGVAPGIGPFLSAALWVAAEVVSMIPQTSPTATTSPFTSTYVGLQAKFATMVSETKKGLGVMSQEVRQDLSLLGLVGDLRANGPWATNHLDMIGLQSAANQAFAIWVYQTLMPTLYERYHITNCHNGFHWQYDQCTAPTGLGVVSGAGEDFTMIGPPHQVNQDVPHERVPCVVQQDYQDVYDVCTWTKPPDDLMTKVWGTPSDRCTYVPGKSETAWTFGDCNAGVDVLTSIGENTWNFPSSEGDPDPYDAPGGFTASAAAARAAAVPPRSSIRLGRGRLGRRSAVGGRAQLSGGVVVPRRMRLAGATVTVDRLLFDRRGRGELARPYGGRPPRALRLTLRRAAPGRFTAAIKGRRSVRVTLRRGRRGHARLTLGIGAAALRAPQACHALPASVARDAPPLYLESRLLLSHGRLRHRLRLEHHVRCARDARGNVDRLVFVPNRRLPARPGLAVSLHGPRRVRPGTIARYVAVLRNRRHGRRRLASSLWAIAFTTGSRTTRIHELRRGRARVLSFRRRVPTAARTPFCVRVVATAAGARAADARACAAVGAARAPAFTG
jgi:hypothetical protein